MPLLLHLLIMGGFHRENTDNGYQNEEHDGLGLSHALGFQGVGIDDVQGQHFRGVDDSVVGATVGQGQVLVVELEGVGQGQEGANGDGRHDIGNDDVPQGLPLGSTVDLRSLQHIHRHRLKSGDINNHHIADLLPGHKDDETPEAVGGVQQNRGIIPGQNAIKNHRPDIAQNDAANQVGHEEHGSENIGALNALGQQVRHGKGQNIDDQQRNQSKARRIPEGMEEAFVCKGLYIVVQARPGPFAGGFEITERKEQALSEGIEESDAEGNERRKQENGEALLNGTTDQNGVQCRTVVLFLE